MSPDYALELIADLLAQGCSRDEHDCYDTATLSTYNEAVDALVAEGRAEWTLEDRMFRFVKVTE